MLDRTFIEKMLKANGVPATAPDEEIRSILLAANWQQEDVSSALVVLRQNKETAETKVDVSEDIFRSDSRLSPEAISRLLGIDVEVTRQNSTAQSSRHYPSALFQAVEIGLVTLVLAAGVFVFCMWFWKWGIFHYSFGI